MYPEGLGVSPSRASAYLGAVLGSPQVEQVVRPSGEPEGRQLTNPKGSPSVLGLYIGDH